MKVAKESGHINRMYSWLTTRRMIRGAGRISIHDMLAESTCVSNQKKAMISLRSLGLQREGKGGSKRKSIEKAIMRQHQSVK